MACGGNGLTTRNRESTNFMREPNRMSMFGGITRLTMQVLCSGNQEPNDDELGMPDLQEIETEAQIGH